MYHYELFILWLVTLTTLVFFLVWLWNIKLRKEVERKTEALAQSAIELRNANEQWEHTFDAVPDFIMILDSNHRILKMNRATFDALNLDATSLTDLKCHELFHGSSMPPPSCPHTQLINDGREHSGEMFVERLGLYVDVSVSPLTDNSGRLIGSVHVARNINDRKLNEKRAEILSSGRAKILGETRFPEKMKLIADCMDDLFEKAAFRIWMIDIIEIDTEANPTAYESTRLKTIGNVHFRLVANSCDHSSLAPDQGWDAYENRFLEQLVQKMAGHKGDDGEDHERYTADHHCSIPLLSQTGAPMGAFLFVSKKPLSNEADILLKAVIRDITHILRDAIAENILKESEKRFRHLFESLVDVYVRTDAAGKIELISPSVASISGSSPKDFQNTYIFEYTDNPKQMEEFLREIRLRGTLHNREILLKRKNGASFWASFNAKQVRDAQNNFIGAEVMFRDVTEKKLTEELVRIQRDLSVALIHARDFTQALDICLNAALKIKEVDCGGIYLMDPATGGLTLRVHRDLPPDFVDAVSHLDKDSPQAKLVAKGEPIFQSYQEMVDCFGLSAKDKTLRQLFDLHAVAVVPMSHEGRIIGCLNVASTTHDSFSEFSISSLEAITGQMAAVLVKIQTDQALKVSQYNLKTLFESLDDFLFILDDSGRILETNSAVERRLGYTADEFKTMHVTQVHPLERRQEAIELVQQMIAGQAEFCPIPLLTRGGELIPVETKVTPGTWNGRPALFGISRDIHLRVEAEEARKISEARLMAAIDAIDEGFVIYDKDDRLAMCNTKYIDIYSDSEDLIKPGAKFEDIIREGAYRGQYADARGDVERWVSERLTQHRRSEHSLEQHLNDGRWLRIVERKMEDGGTVGFRVDITDMKRTEDLLRNALLEKETLLREIHHRVKNNLAVISSMLNLQVRHNKNEVVRKSLQETRDRVRSMALIHETLHQTHNQSIVKFKDYIRKLIGDLLSAYENFSEQFVINYDIDELELDLNQAVYCGLIINELITNSFKYAFVGKERGAIHISARWIGENVIRLSVKDDGIGLPPTLDWRNSNTLGLRLIVLMAEQLHGSLELNSHNGLETVIQWKNSLLKSAPVMVS